MIPPKLGDYASALSQSNQGWRQGIVVITGSTPELIDMSGTRFYCVGKDAIVFDHTTLPEPLRAWAIETRFDTIRRAKPDARELIAQDAQFGLQLWLFSWGHPDDRTYTFEVRDNMRIIQSSSSHSHESGNPSSDAVISEGRTTFDELVRLAREDDDEELHK